METCKHCAAYNHAFPNHFYIILLYNVCYMHGIIVRVHASVPVLPTPLILNLALITHAAW